MSDELGGKKKSNDKLIRLKFLYELTNCFTTIKELFHLCYAIVTFLVKIILMEDM